mgnify:CR=1 FL=1
MIKGILFLAIACMIFVAGQRKSNNIIQQNLKSNLIRFHVRANSNSRMDQTYKLKVRDAVIDQISPELSEAKTKEEAFKILKMQKNRIKNTAQEILKKEGVKQKVNVHFVQEKFPEKNYGQYTFPEGIYDAVRIDLGAAKGHNWWCVMYPPLCLPAAAAGHGGETRQRIESLSSSPGYEARFAVVEWAERLREHFAEKKAVSGGEQKENAGEGMTKNV